MIPDPNLRVPIAISLGAIAGALTRYYLNLWLLQKLGTQFPYGIFFINVTGCLGMGFLATLATARIPWFGPELQILLTVGFLGSYTTFSTYGLDTVKLWQADRWASAGLYAIGSAVLGILGIQMGTWLARLCRF